MNLRVLAGAIVQVYPVDPVNQGGTFPTNLTCVAVNYMDAALMFFVCPGTGDIAKALDKVDEWTDYVYVFWPTGLNHTPGTYPLLYDRRLSNHQGAGVNVALVNGTVFWDAKARWLKKFMVEHPNLRIPLPE